ncbi:MAG: YARHG domain-containing protein [Bacteroidales bacterium]|nr:YARHG domain-containing protein [Bacteroidales bacterium]
MKDIQFDEQQSKQQEHARRLEEIERQSRAADEAADKAATNNDNNVFAEAIQQSLDTRNTKTTIPLMEQEEIEEEEPRRVNLTAVICTAIVALCATIILCVAKPWSDGDNKVAAVNEEQIVQNDEKANEQPDAKQQEMDREAKLEAERQALEERRKAEEQRAEEERQKAEEQRKAAEQSNVPSSTLPVVATTSTGTANPYNNIRLIDASTRILTSAELASMTKTELALARNAIYARHGYQYNNAELKEYFAKQSWFKPVAGLKMDDVQKKFTKVEVTNINLILSQEKK